MKRILLMIALSLLPAAFFCNEPSERAAIQAGVSTRRAYSEFLRHPSKSNRRSFLSLLAALEKVDRSARYVVQDAIACRYDDLENAVNSHNYQALLVTLAIYKFDHDIHFRPVLGLLLADYCAQHPRTFLKAANESEINESEIVDLISVTTAEEGDETVNCEKLKSRKVSLETVRDKKHIPLVDRLLARLRESLNIYCGA